MASAKKNKVPFYRQKEDRSKYFDCGDPTPMCHDDLAREIHGWIEPTEEELGFWEDSKECVLSKNKKRQFLMDVTQPKKTANGKFVMDIEVLHLDYRGFTYSDEADSATQLERNFWPVVNKLLAHFFSPKVQGKEPAPPVPFVPPEDKTEKSALRDDSIARFMAS